MLLRIAIVDDLPQDAERLQQALTAEGQTNIIRYESGDALLSAISPEQLDALLSIADITATPDAMVLPAMHRCLNTSVTARLTMSRPH